MKNTLISTVGLIALVAVGCARPPTPPVATPRRVSNEHVSLELPGAWVLVQRPDRWVEVGRRTDDRCLLEYRWFADISGNRGDPRSIVARSVNPRLKRLSRRNEAFPSAPPAWTYFGPNAFYSWPEARNGLDEQYGLCIVGPVVIELCLYLPRGRGTSDADRVRSAIERVLSSMRPDSPPALLEAVETLRMRPFTFPGAVASCFVPEDYEATVTADRAVVMPFTPDRRFRLEFSHPFVLDGTEGDPRERVAALVKRMQGAGPAGRLRLPSAAPHWIHYGATAYYAWEEQERGLTALHGKVLVEDRVFDLEARFSPGAAPGQHRARYGIQCILRSMVVGPN